MRVIVTVYGLDRVGIIYGVCKLLADMSGATKGLVKLREQLNELGKEIGVTIRIQSEDIFTAMHTV